MCSNSYPPNCTWNCAWRCTPPTNGRNWCAPKPIAVNLDGNTHYLSLSVFPDEEPQREGFSVVIFERLLDFSLPAATTTQSADQGTETDEVVQSLQNELDRTKQRLQGIVEEYETSPGRDEGLE